MRLAVVTIWFRVGIVALMVAYRQYRETRLPNLSVVVSQDAYRRKEREAVYAEAAQAAMIDAASDMSVATAHRGRAITSYCSECRAR